MWSIQIKRGGKIALPREWCNHNKLEIGDRIILADAGDGVIVMQHKKFQVDEAADALAQELRANGITLEDLLEELKKLRK